MFQIRIVILGEMIVFIVDIINVWVMCVVIVFFGVYYKDIFIFFGVQGFVWIVYVVFIGIVVNDWCNVGVVFVVLVVQGVKYFFRIRKFVFIVCECVVVVLQIYVYVEIINWNFLLLVFECYFQQFLFGVVVWFVIFLVVVEYVFGFQLSMVSQLNEFVEYFSYVFVSEEVIIKFFVKCVEVILIFLMEVYECL